MKQIFVKKANEKLLLGVFAAASALLGCSQAIANNVLPDSELDKLKPIEVPVSKTEFKFKKEITFLSDAEENINYLAAHNLQQDGKIENLTKATTPEEIRKSLGLKEVTKSEESKDTGSKELEKELTAKLKKEFHTSKEVEKYSYAGTAIALAVGNLPQVQSGKASILSVGAGYYQDSLALAVGGSFNVGDNLILKGGVGAARANLPEQSSKYVWGASLALGYQF